MTGPARRSGIVRWPRAGVLPRLRLICVPHAGGAAASFHAWSSALPDAIEVCAVQLPGRHDRIREPPFRRFTPVIDALAGELAPWLDQPFALYGHSLGGFLAFELAHRLQRDRLAMPVVLVVGGCRAPHLPPQLAPIAQLPDAAFLRAVTRMGGIPAELLASPELLALLVPVLRADFEVMESYRHTLGPPLPCPLTALGGRDDSDVSAADLDAWRRHTSASFRAQRYPGGHFFPSTCPTVVTDLRDTLTSYIAP